MSDAVVERHAKLPRGFIVELHYVEPTYRIEACSEEEAVRLAEQELRRMSELSSVAGLATSSGAASTSRNRESVSRGRR